jgi:RNA polymerase sigma factor (sigma-70 family)
MIPTEYISKRQSIYKGYFYNRCEDSELTKDLFQDFFLRVYEKQKGKELMTEEQLDLWLWRVARSVHIDYVRKYKNRGMTSYDENPMITAHRNNAIEPEIENKLEVEQYHELIKRSLHKMKPEFALVYRMRVLGDVSFIKIADCLNVSINTVLGHMRYARIHLKKDLQLN